MESIKNKLLLLFFTYLFVFGGFLGYGVLLIIRPMKWIGLNFFYRSLTHRVFYYHSALLPAAAQLLSDIKVNVYTDPEIMKKLGKEKAVVVMNHRYQLDWLALFITMLQLRVLHDFKAIVKRALLWVPVIGWALYFNEAVFINRSYSSDKQLLAKRLKKLSESPSFWLVLFCEGTRLTPEKHKVSVEYAEKKGVEPLKHHLLPRTKGFAVVRKEFEGKVPCLYDATVMCPGDSPPPLSSFLTGKHEQVDILLRRIPFDEVPRDEEGSSDYLKNLYYYKDQMCEHYSKHQEFPIEKEPELKNFIKYPMNPRRQCLQITLGWSLLLMPLFLYISYSVISSGICLRTVACVPIMIVSGMFIYRSMLKSGSVSSTYGQ